MTNGGCLRTLTVAESVSDIVQFYKVCEWVGDITGQLSVGSILGETQGTDPTFRAGSRPSLFDAIKCTILPSQR